MRGKIGRPRLRADSVIADRGYDHDKYRRQLWGEASSRSSPAAAPSTAQAWDGGAGSSSALSPGCTSSAACASAGSRPELHEAFMHLACAFICQRFLRAL